MPIAIRKIRSNFHSEPMAIVDLDDLFQLAQLGDPAYTYHPHVSSYNGDIELDDAVSMIRAKHAIVQHDLCVNIGVRTHGKPIFLAENVDTEGDFNVYEKHPQMLNRFEFEFNAHPAFNLSLPSITPRFLAGFYPTEGIETWANATARDIIGPATWFMLKTDEYKKAVQVAKLIYCVKMVQVIKERKDAAQATVVRSNLELRMHKKSIDKLLDAISKG